MWQQVIRWTPPVILGGYWLVLFISTHLPPKVAQGLVKLPDKHLHFFAFAALAIAMAACWRSRGPLRAVHYGIMGCVIALYGAFDEVSQMLVRREAELADWFADVAGASCGLALFAGAMALLNRYGAFRNSAPTPLGSASANSTAGGATASNGASSPTIASLARSESPAAHD